MSIALNMEDLQAPERSTGPTGAPYRFTATKERETTKYVELAMSKDQVAKDLFENSLPEDKAGRITLGMSFLPADKAVSYGLSVGRYLVISKPTLGLTQKGARAKGSQSVGLRVGTYEWTEEQLKTMQEEFLNKPAGPIAAQMGETKVLLFKLHELMEG